MATTNTWNDIVSILKGVSNKGVFSITFTPANTAQSVSWDAGYYSQVVAGCNAVGLSGNASTGQVLSGYTFYSNSLTLQSGSMPNRGYLSWAPSGNTSYSLPAGYYSGGMLDTINAYNSGLAVLNQLICTDVVSGNLSTSYNFWCPYEGRYLVITCASRGSKGDGPASSITTNGTPITYSRWWIGGDSPSQVQCKCLHGMAFMFLQASVGTLITVEFASGYTSDGFAMVFKLGA